MLRSQQSRLRFALAALATLSLVLGLGWLTGLRDALRGGLLFAAVSALFPLLLVAAVLGAFVIFAVVLALTAGEDLEIHGGAEGLVIGGGKLMRFYYGALWRQRRHPVVWGLLAGFFSGVLALEALIVIVLVPREVENLELLSAAQRRIEGTYAETRRYPQAAEDGILRRNMLSDPSDEAMLDLFGHPIEYRTGGKLLQSYRLRSLGYDGKPSDDDVCLSGETRLTAWVRKTLDQVEIDPGDFGGRARVLTSTRCRGE